MTKNEVIYKEFLKKYPISETQNKKYLEDSISEYLHKYHRIKIERASYDGRFYPELLILDRTRNIFGYICIQHHSEGKVNLSKQTEFDNITKKRIQVYYSELDRPVFFLHWFSTKNSEGIYFLTSEQIQDILLKKIEEGDTTPFFPNKEIMGGFDEFINIIKKNI